MKRSDRVILEKVISEIDVLRTITLGISEEAFLSNDELMRATCMTLINIGELVKKLSDEFRVAHPQIPWKDITGLRDVTAHGYFTLRMDDIWLYASGELPEQREQIKLILDAEQEG